MENSKGIDHAYTDKCIVLCHFLLHIIKQIPVWLIIIFSLSSIVLSDTKDSRHERNRKNDIILFQSTVADPSVIAPEYGGQCSDSVNITAKTMFRHIDALEGEDCGKEFNFRLNYKVVIKSLTSGTEVSETSGQTAVACIQHKRRGSKEKGEDYAYGYLPGPTITASWGGTDLTGNYVSAGSYDALIKVKLLRVKIEKEHKDKAYKKEDKGHEEGDEEEHERHDKDRDTKLIASAFTATGSFSADTAPPQLTIDYPQDNDILCSSTTLVDGSVNSSSPSTVYVNGQSAPVNNGKFVLPSLVLSNGSNTINAIVTDQCGLSSSRNIQVTSEIYAPTGIISYPASGSYTSESTIVISGYYYGGSDTSISANGELCVTGLGTFDCLNTSLLTGLNTFDIKLVNQCGETNTIETSIIQNSMPPNVQITSPDTLYTNHDDIPVYGTVTSPIPVSVVINGMQANIIGNIFTLSSLSLTEGTNQIQVVATDAAENSSSVTTHITVDTIAPILWVNFPMINFTISTYQLDIPVLVSDAEKMDISVEGDTITNVISGLHIFKNVSLIDGENNIVISARDWAGNVTNTRLTITVNPNAEHGTIQGLVRANTGAGITNVTVTLKDTGLTTTTDNTGAYTFTEVTPGQYVVAADGGTYATSYGRGYTSVLVPEGNTVTASDIYLTPIDAQNGVYVSRNQNTIITSPSIPGLSISIPAGDAIFPDKSESGWVYAQTLSPDTLPVPLPPGYMGTVYIDLEPSGLSFNQPVDFTLPNLEGLPAQTIVHIYTSDPDSGMYDYIGDGIVSDDGTQVIPLPGVTLGHFSVIFTTTYSAQIHATIDFITTDGITHSCPGPSGNYYMCQHQIAGCAGQDVGNSWGCDPNQQIPPFWLPNYWEIPVCWGAVSPHKPEQYNTICATETIAFPGNPSGAPTPIVCKNCESFPLSSTPNNIPSQLYYTMYVPVQTRVLGRVVDANHTPIQGVRLVISGDSKTPNCNGPQAFPAINTGTDGRFDETHVLGDPTIHLEYGYYSNSYSFSAGPDGGYTNVGDIVLPITISPVSGSTFTVTGTFTWADGSARPGADIELFDPATDAIIADSSTDANGNFVFTNINSALFAGTYFGLVHDDLWFCRLSDPSIHLGIIPSSGVIDGSFSEPPSGLYIVPLSPVISGITSTTSPVIANSMVTGTPGLACGSYFTSTITIENSAGEIKEYDNNGYRLTVPMVTNEPPGPIHIKFYAIAGGIGQDQYDWYGYVLTPSTVTGTTFTISGTVSMSDGSPLAGARIKLFNTDTGMDAGSFIAYTDTNGEYTITGVPTGLLSSEGYIGVDAYAVLNDNMYSGNNGIQVTGNLTHATADINIPTNEEQMVFPSPGSIVQSPFFIVIRNVFPGIPTSSLENNNISLVLNNMDSLGNPTDVAAKLNNSYLDEDVQLLPVAFVSGNVSINGDPGTIFTVTGVLPPPSPSPPSIALSFTTPAAGTYTNKSSLYVAGTFSGDVSNIMLSVNGTSQGNAYLNPDANTFTGTVTPLVEGYIKILALGTSPEGAYAQTETWVYYDASPPSLDITWPLQGSVVTSASTIISGLVSDTVTPADQITVWAPNSIVPCTNLSGSFTCFNVMLLDGQNNVIISASDLVGNTATGTVNVISATRPPAINIISPSNGDKLASTSIAVYGIVSDNYGLSLSVTVNRTGALISNNEFFATGITLSTGITNTIQAIAVDSAGLASTTSVSVTYQTQSTFTLTWNYPGEGETVNTTAPLAEVSYTDTTNGINFTSLTLTLDGVPINPNNVYSFEQYEDSADWYLQNIIAGTHTLVASISNGSGIVSQTTTTFTVRPAIVISRVIQYNQGQYALSTSAHVGDTVIISGYGLDTVTSVCLTGSNAGTSNCAVSTNLKGGGIGISNLQFLTDPHYNTEIVITIPSGSVTGPLIAGNISEVSNAFILPIIPVIQNLSSRVVSPGQVLSIYGTGFSLLPSDDAVELNGINCPIGEVTNGMIEALIPNNAVSGHLRVIVNGTSSGAIGLIVVDPSKNQIPGIANSTNPVTPGQTAVGYFSSSTQKDTYTFEAQQGSFISIDTVSMDDQGDPALGGVELLMRVYAPDGEEIASLDQPSTQEQWAHIDNLYLNQTGTYAVVLSVSQHSTAQTGAYQCSITVPHGVYIQDANPGIGITWDTVVLTGRDFTSSPYIYFTSSTGSQLSYTSDSMTVGTSSVTFTMPAFTGTVVSMSAGSNQNGLPYTYADVISDVTVAHSAQPVPMYREDHQYWFSYPQQITGATESYLNPVTDGQLFTVPITASGASITFTVSGVDSEGSIITDQTVYPAMKLYTPSGFAVTTSTNGTLAMQFAVTGTYQLAVLPVSGTSNLIRLNMHTGYIPMSQPFRMTIVSGELQLGAYGTTNPQPMTVLVSDEMQNPVSGVTVYFADNDQTIAEYTGSDGTASAPAGTFTFDAPYNTVKFITAYIADPTGNMMPGLVATFKMYTLFPFGSRGMGIPYKITPIDPTEYKKQVGTTVPLHVVVTDQMGYPVSNTIVKFYDNTGDATFNSNQYYITSTDGYGIANAIVTLGTSTTTPNSVVQMQIQANADDPYPTQVGFSSINIQSLAVPDVNTVDGFILYALPDKAFKLSPYNSYEQLQSGIPNMPLNLPISYKVLDEYNNPVSNSPVIFSVLPATGTTGSNFINAVLYDDTNIAVRGLSTSCGQGTVPPYRIDNCSLLKSQLTTTSRGDGDAGVLMYLGNTPGIIYNGEAALQNGSDTQYFWGYAQSVSGISSTTPTWSMECSNPVQNQINIVNMYLPYPFTCTAVGITTDTSSPPEYQTIVDTDPNATYVATVDSVSTFTSATLSKDGPVYPCFSTITLHPDSSGKMNIWFKLGGPTSPYNNCKGVDHYCINEFNVKGLGDRASVNGDIASIGRDVEIFLPQPDQTGLITYQIQQNGAEFLIPVEIVAGIRAHAQNAIDLNRVKFNFGLSITYPGWGPNDFWSDNDHNLDQDRFYLSGIDPTTGATNGSMANSFVAFQDPASGGITWLYQKVWLPALGFKVYGGFATAMVSITDATSGNPVNPLSSDSVKFNLIGHNPIQSDVLSVLCNNNSQFAALGFTTNFLAAAAYQESRFAEFTNLRRCGPTVTDLLALTDGYPAQACDNGYGIMQLTNGVPGGLNNNLPPKYWTGTPTQDMVWNWESNVNAGTDVMMSKLQWARMYSSQDYQWMRYPKYIGCNFLPMIPDQLQMETWQAYNGGSYYIVDTSNYPLSCGWIPNTAALLYSYGSKCKSVNPNYVYADCTKYWSQQSQFQCK